MDVASRGVSAIVEYDYEAKEPDELDLVKGALIHSVKQMPGGWWQGTLQSNGKTGMFPDNFVRVVDNSDDENKVTIRDKAATVNRRCKVIFSYTQVNDDELSLAVGDVIEFLGEVEEGWWRGRLKNKIGVFPSNFVTVIEPSPIFASKRPAAGPTATTTAQSSIGKVTTASNSAASTAATASTSMDKSNIVGVSNSSNITTSTSSSATTNVSSTATATTTATKKMNRISFHSSKEDLLNCSLSSVSNASATTSSSQAGVFDDIAPTLPPKPQREYCRVEFPYTPQNDDELDLKVGEIITIISTDLPDRGWWKGELHGKVGVFPDNFVKLLEVTSLSDPQQPQRTAKAANATTTANANTAHLRSATGAAATSAAHTAAAGTSSKVLIKKSGSNSSTQSSNRKDSFGSYDSLNDILSETGLQSGNVAAQRKSLENKNLDLTANAADASSRLALKKQQLQQQQQQHLQETKTILTNNGGFTTTTTTTTSSMMSSSTAAALSNELRKSLENLDEKTKITPPPVLTKKPTVTTKKPSSVSGVASNLFGFGKQKTKSTDSKLTTAVSHDIADGMGSSKMSTSSQSEAVVMRRAATIAVEDSDFDHLERASILPDMRAGRVKAPKRRPPSAAINIIGESNNNNTIYLNGSGAGGGVSAGELSQDEGKLQSSDENSTGEETLAKPKPREWEKKKAPWMEELKASQVKKKTSPNVEPRTQVADRSSSLLGDDVKVTSNNHTSSISSSSSSHTHSNNATSSSVTTTTKIHSSSTSVSSSQMQQSMTVESSQQLLKKELNSNTIADIMTKSMSNKFTTDSSLSAAASTNAPPIDDVRIRPNSLSIRNRSMSPSMLESSGTANSARSTAMKSSASVAPSESSSNGTVPTNVPTAATAAGSSQNSAGATNHYQQRTSSGTTASLSGDGTRIGELERRVGKLELTVVTQQRTIDELMRLLREETDRVKVLRGELDKYAQCVTQV
ncbi:uncharacterized protein LOC101456020 isoform X1 [Ceratitis capitata]|uniref:uncharacterized protein LOC101456020 isoform X1 n=1 Tax=Ceratitis capitata TaxID=7213 RepID=UPI000329B0A7|nr:uncharacterized protein LOC101456020 isoform X1 [Ceratitis capitata]XP_020712992.1 uncharacterized protein LOC101456020 isoform X1 [Ceratitis capitata]XP_020712993.1 uncharacterized protein LOC101456020 isoform X1 [Ceratitis capitata]XP_020712994.1 uncharacterized protein LOC101456020 isoform X1 [Ceratitis capitata]